MHHEKAAPRGGQPYTVACVFGTRPEAIKMAPVISALRTHPEWFRTQVIVTAQHRDMLDQVLTTMDITPDYDLDIMTAGQSLSDITVRVLQGLDPIFAEDPPAMVLVHGDTTTTFTAALAAFYRRIPVGHVEAGLRTGNPYRPFPEEMNRRLTGVLTQLHFAPTDLARRRLLAENVPESSIFVTGNTVIDALLQTVDTDYEFHDPFLRQLDFQRHRVIVVTTHRRENWGAPLTEVYKALRTIVERFDDVVLVFPVHRNPIVREPAAAAFAGLERAYLFDPPPYEEFVNLMARCHFILTDSGGIQEEAPALGKPVLVLRDATERPETLASGALRLVGTDGGRIVEEASRLLADEDAYTRMARPSSPVGDGRAGERIAHILMHHFGLRSDLPDPFRAPKGAPVASPST